MGHKSKAKQSNESGTHGSQTQERDGSKGKEEESNSVQNQRSEKAAEHQSFERKTDRSHSQIDEEGNDIGARDDDRQSESASKRGEGSQ